MQRFVADLPRGAQVVQFSTFRTQCRQTEATLKVLFLHGTFNVVTSIGATTQVTNEGSNMSVYEVGKTIKKEFDLLEAYDMTLEATVTKLMWILGQTEDPAEIRRLFYKTINRDILFTAAVCQN